jgi:hypothetical protein
LVEDAPRRNSEIRSRSIFARATHSASVIGGLTSPNSSVMVLPKSVFSHGWRVPSGNCTSMIFARTLSHSWSIAAVEPGSCLMVIVEMPGRDVLLISSMDLSSLILRSSGFATNSSTRGSTATFSKSSSARARRVVPAR